VAKPKGGGFFSPDIRPPRGGKGHALPRRLKREGLRKSIETGLPKDSAEVIVLHHGSHNCQGGSKDDMGEGEKRSPFANT